MIEDARELRDLCPGFRLPILAPAGCPASLSRSRLMLHAMESNKPAALPDSSPRSIGGTPFFSRRSFTSSIMITAKSATVVPGYFLHHLIAVSANPEVSRLVASPKSGDRCTSAGVEDAACRAILLIPIAGSPSAGSSAFSLLGGNADWRCGVIRRIGASAAELFASRLLHSSAACSKLVPGGSILIGRFGRTAAAKTDCWIV